MADSAPVSESRVEAMYSLAHELYAEMGVDVELALNTLRAIPISLHCWQGDDVRGFEQTKSELGGGLAVTGNFPGRARNADELRQDLEMALSLIPGRHRLNLHACYGEFNSQKVDRDEIEPRHFQGWIDWARQQHLGLDFNPTYFAHPKAATGWTLAHIDEGIRAFWIEHGKRCRSIAATMGRQLGSPTVNNVWIPDGCKEAPVDRRSPRERLIQSLDAIFEEPYDTQHLLDAVECKLFGIGSESYVVGSHEFYLGYAITRRKVLCLDSGHFHPTESIGDKVSSTMAWIDRLLLHVSRGIRWDSDHVVVWNDQLCEIIQEVVRGGYLPRVHIGLDYFDASINRVAAWVIGVRNVQRALLAALLEPIDRWRSDERNNDTTARLALTEEQKSMPLSAVWNMFCLREQVPQGTRWLDHVRRYESQVLSTRSE